MPAHHSQPNPTARTLLDRIARLFRMTDEAWRRHANPWSVYTRFAAIPALVLAIWSRVWIGWWAFGALAVVIVWLLLNPHVFRPVNVPQSWAAKGIYGEKLWLESKGNLPPGYRTAFRWLMIPGLAGIALLVWGLVALLIWPTVFGATLIALAQLWRIDRLGYLYDEVMRRRLNGN
ncbi:DUF6653 family protein [Bosea sp. LjRoot9]|uniref:DUF6653 family protein n=1 Tax=Bosea sp. LjRoot9 TaxID=3342341 RepID=UPI003F4F71FC